MSGAVLVNTLLLCVTISFGASANAAWRTGNLLTGTLFGFITGVLAMLYVTRTSTCTTAERREP